MILRLHDFNNQSIKAIKAIKVINFINLLELFSSSQFFAYFS